ncbi:unnamed protein product [Brassica rapa subsp. narinosa]
MEAEVYTAELRSHPASRAQKVTSYRTSREAGGRWSTGRWKRRFIRLNSGPIPRAEHKR